MKTRLFSTVLGPLTVALVCLVGTGSTFAGPVFIGYDHNHSHPQQRLLRPQQPPVIGYPTPMPVTPRLGFMGHVQYGFGMVVDSVNYGSFASRMGLERGDTIIRINNLSIRNDGSYNRAVLDAVQHHNGFLDLVVVDVRTGMTRHRTGYLNAGGSGPVLPRARPYNHVSASFGF